MNEIGEALGAEVAIPPAAMPLALFEARNESDRLRAEVDTLRAQRERAWDALREVESDSIGCVNPWFGGEPCHDYEPDVRCWCWSCTASVLLASEWLALVGASTREGEGGDLTAVSTPTTTPTERTEPHE